MIFEGDVKLIDTLDDGDLEIVDNFIQMAGGIETAAYLSLFGGNKGDNGTNATKNKGWWGNQLETIPERKLISRTQNIMFTTEATPGNLLKIIKAAKQDLAWFKNIGFADTIDVTGNIPGPKKLNLYIEIKKDGKTLGDFEFLENWRSAKPGDGFFIKPEPPVIVENEYFETNDGFFIATNDGKYLWARSIIGGKS